MSDQFPFDNQISTEKALSILESCHLTKLQVEELKHCYDTGVQMSSELTDLIDKVASTMNFKVWNKFLWSAKTQEIITRNILNNALKEKSRGVYAIPVFLRYEHSSLSEFELSSINALNTEFRWQSLKTIKEDSIFLNIENSLPSLNLETNKIHYLLLYLRSENNSTKPNWKTKDWFNDLRMSSEASNASVKVMVCHQFHWIDAMTQMLNFMPGKNFWGGESLLHAPGHHGIRCIWRGETSRLFGLMDNIGHSHTALPGSRLVINNAHVCNN